MSAAAHVKRGRAMQPQRCLQFTQLRSIRCQFSRRHGPPPHLHASTNTLPTPTHSHQPTPPPHTTPPPVQLLEEKKELVEAMARALLDKEVLNSDDLEAILGERPFRSLELRNIDRFRGNKGGEEAAAPVSDDERRARRCSGRGFAGKRAGGRGSCAGAGRGGPGAAPPGASCWACVCYSVPRFAAAAAAAAATHAPPLQSVQHSPQGQQVMQLRPPVTRHLPQPEDEKEAAAPPPPSGDLGNDMQPALAAQQAQQGEEQGLEGHREAVEAASAAATAAEPQGEQPVAQQGEGRAEGEGSGSKGQKQGRRVVAS